jgi:hypothetical protein
MGCSAKLLSSALYFFISGLVGGQPLPFSFVEEIYIYLYFIAWQLFNA